MRKLHFILFSCLITLLSFEMSFAQSKIQTGKTSEIQFYKSLVQRFPFKDYPANKTYQGKIAQLDLSYFKSIDNNTIKGITSRYNNQNQPNFAGHYIIVSWSCGSPCQMNAIIDAKTGKAVQFINTAVGLDFRLNSCLLIENPPTTDKYDQSFRALIGRPKFLIFENQNLVELKK